MHVTKFAQDLLSKHHKSNGAVDKRLRKGHVIALLGHDDSI
jgi:hypothetical protein